MDSSVLKEQGLQVLAEQGLRLVHAGLQTLFVCLEWNPVRVDQMPERGERVLVAIEEDEGPVEAEFATWWPKNDEPRWVMCWCGDEPAGRVVGWARAVLPAKVVEELRTMVAAEEVQG